MRLLSCRTTAIPAIEKRPEWDRSIEYPMAGATNSRVRILLWENARQRHLTYSHSVWLPMSGPFILVVSFIKYLFPNIFKHIDA